MERGVGDVVAFKAGEVDVGFEGVGENTGSGVGLAVEGREQAMLLWFQGR